jgi:hypothetical protein
MKLPCREALRYAQGLELCRTAPPCLSCSNGMRNRVIGILLSSIGGLETIIPEATMELITIIRGASEAVKISFGPLNHLNQFHFR